MFKRLKYYYCKWMMETWHNTIKFAKKRRQYWSVKAFNALLCENMALGKKYEWLCLANDKYKKLIEEQIDEDF